MKQYEKEDLRCCGNCKNANLSCSFCLELKKNINASGVCDEWEFDGYDEYERKSDLCELDYEM